MSRIKWDEDAKRLYETGTSKGVLYTQKDDGKYNNGVGWNGLIGVSKNPSGAEETALYANNSKYASMRSAEEQEGSITAYTYPDEWAECDGSREVAPGFKIGQQTRRAFGMTWQTILGNDVQLDGYGYKIHIIYSATASPSEQEYTSVNDSPEAIEFSWDYKCTPIDPDIEGKDLKKSATITIDSTQTPKAAMKEIEDTLYGTDDDEPTILMPNEIYEIIQKHTKTEDGGDAEVQTMSQTAKTNVAEQTSTTPGTKTSSK